MLFPWQDANSGGAGLGTDHWVEMEAATILRPAGFIYSVIHRPVDLLEANFLCNARGNDPPCLLPHCGLVPTRALSVVSAHVKCVIDRNGPNTSSGLAFLRISSSRSRSIIQSSVTSVKAYKFFNRVFAASTPKTSSRARCKSGSSMKTCMLRNGSALSGFQRHS